MAGHFSEVTENSHAGIIWIIALLGLSYSVLTFFTRALIKWHMLGPDDYILVAAQVSFFRNNIQPRLWNLTMAPGLRFWPIWRSVCVTAKWSWTNI